MLNNDDKLLSWMPQRAMHPLHLNIPCHYTCLQCPGSARATEEAICSLLIYVTANVNEIFKVCILWFGQQQNCRNHLVTKYDLTTALGRNLTLPMF